MEWYEKFGKLREILGDDTVLTAVLNYFSSNEIDEFVDSVASEYDIENELNEC